MPDATIEDDLRRAGLVLPVILDTEDVRLALRLKTRSGARRAILAGRAGPYLRDGRRLLVRRETFLQHLAARERTPVCAPARVRPLRVLDRPGSRL